MSSVIHIPTQTSPNIVLDGTSQTITLTDTDGNIGSYAPTNQSLQNINGSAIVLDCSINEVALFVANINTNLSSYIMPDGIYSINIDTFNIGFLTSDYLKLYDNNTNLESSSLSKNSLIISDIPSLIHSNLTKSYLEITNETDAPNNIQATYGSANVIMNNGSHNTNISLDTNYPQLSITDSSGNYSVLQSNYLNFKQGDTAVDLTAVESPSIDGSNGCIIQVNSTTKNTNYITGYMFDSAVNPPPALCFDYTNSLNTVISETSSFPLTLNSATLPPIFGTQSGLNSVNPNSYNWELLISISGIPSNISDSEIIGIQYSFVDGDDNPLDCKFYDTNQTGDFYYMPVAVVSTQGYFQATIRDIISFPSNFAGYYPGSITPSITFNSSLGGGSGPVSSIRQFTITLRPLSYYTAV